MRLKKIFFGITAGWFVLSLGALAYVELFVDAPPAAPATAMPRKRLAPLALARRVANPPDFEPKRGIDVEADPELAALVYRYFPKPLSQHLEEVFIRDYFEDRKGGFLLDVGASHYKTRSTTHYMDVALGWRGIAVDAIAELGADYVKHRPRTKFFGVFVGDKSDADVDFYVSLNNSRLSSANEAAAKNAGDAEKRPMKTVTLDALLDSQGVKKVDLLSMDIELWEPKALAGFDIDRFKPELAVIELHALVRQEIYDYFAKHDYVELEKYSRWDGRNAYFIPKQALSRFLARTRVEPAPALAAATPPTAPPAANAAAH